MSPTDNEIQAGLGLPVTASGLEARYGTTRALRGVNLELAPGRIHGLLGRNGAGKTTLLSVVASLLPLSAGRLEVGGRDPFEDEQRMSEVCLVRDVGTVVGDERIAWNLDFQHLARPSFDRPWAEHLAGVFGLDLRVKPDQLSRGQRSTLNAIIGLASRAPVTMFDEVHVGMDAPTRDRFTELLVADVAERPRTVVLSSHLIDELEHLVETVTVLHRGRVVLHAEADEVRRRGVTVTGPTARVQALAAHLNVIATRDLGPTRQVTAYGVIEPAVLATAEQDGLVVAAAALRDLFAHLTEESS